MVPLEGIALLIGVDRFMSEARAVTNLIGNVWHMSLFLNQKKTLMKN